MRRNSGILRIVLTVTLALIVLVVSAKNLPAGFTTQETHVRVEIDGVDYGRFDKVDGLEQFANDGLPIDEKNTYGRITLKRDFVTDPSLYLWAKNRMSRKFGLNDVHLITEDDEGNEISHQVLRLCQPLSWSVEAINPSIGGFNEKIDLAVQEIEIF